MRDSGRDHHPAGCEVSREALQQESSPRIATCRKPLTEESSCKAGYKTAAVFCVASLLSETWQAGGVHTKDHDPSADISRKLDNSTQLKGRLTLSLSQPSRYFPRKPKERPSAGRARGPTPPQRARNNLGIRRRIIGTRGRHHPGIRGGMSRNLQLAFSTPAPMRSASSARCIRNARMASSSEC